MAEIEHPILFSGDMVHAIIDGRKTQTRRVVQRNNSCPRDKWLWDRLVFDDSIIPDALRTFADNGYLHIACKPHPDDEQADAALWTRQRIYPEWNIGDRLWVKGTWQASRIMLEITNIRVGRVQDISDEDCIAEGLKLLQGGIRSEFRILWDSINAKRGFGWDVNPWVWVIEFKQVKNG